jgi:hypothetical protein
LQIIFIIKKKDEKKQYIISQGTQSGYGVGENIKFGATEKKTQRSTGCGEG